MMQDLGFKERKNDYILAKKFNDYRLIIKVAKHNEEEVPKVSFGIFNSEKKSVPINILEEELSQTKYEMWEDKKTAIPLESEIKDFLYLVAEELRKNNVPFFQVGDKVVLNDEIQTKVMTIDVSNYLIVGLKAVEGIIPMSSTEKIASDPTVYYAEEGEFTWFHIFNIRKGEL